MRSTRFKDIGMDQQRRLLLFAGLGALLTGCTSAKSRKARAEADLAREKTKTMQEYKSCIKKAGTDQEKLDACERLVKAIPASDS
jgi:glycerol-3-phosphate dehydrogenase